MMALPRWVRRLLDVRGQNVALWQSPDSKPAALAAAAKPRVRLRADGWIRHLPGRFPFPDRTVVVTIDSHGKNGPNFASEWPVELWEHRSRTYGRDILFYRIIREPASTLRSTAMETHHEH